jgi:hypothetical protein
MPRDASGNYTLPLGNPVQGNTVIDVNWANPTMADIATQLNNVYTRDGILGPLAPFKLVDGTVSGPGLAFNSEPGMGLFREANNVLGVAVGGNVVARFTPTSFQLANPLLIDKVVLGNGTVGAPALAFLDETNTGLYKDSAGVMAMSVLGVKRVTFSALGLGVVGGLYGDTVNISGNGIINGNVNIGGILNVTGAITGAGVNNAAGSVSRNIVNVLPSTVNTLYLGWASNTVTFQVDNTYFGSNWPINITGNAVSAGLATKASTLASGGGGGGPMVFTFGDGGGSPFWVWGNNGTDNFVFQASQMTVGNATNAANLGGWPSGAYLRGNNAWAAGFASNNIWAPYMEQSPISSGVVVYMVRAAGGCHGLTWPGDTYLHVFNVNGTQVGMVAGYPTMEDAEARRIAIDQLFERVTALEAA